MTQPNCQSSGGLGYGSAQSCVGCNSPFQHADYRLSRACERFEPCCLDLQARPACRPVQVHLLLRMVVLLSWCLRGLELHLAPALTILWCRMRRLAVVVLLPPVLVLRRHQGTDPVLRVGTRLVEQRSLSWSRSWPVRGVRLVQSVTGKLTAALRAVSRRLGARAQPMEFRLVWWALHRGFGCLARKLTIALHQVAARQANGSGRPGKPGWQGGRRRPGWTAWRCCRCGEISVTEDNSIA